MPTRADLHRTYTPYGAFCADGGPWQSFADTHRDQMSGCYLLGNGHRAYSPSLMRFCSPDRMSPFEAGGLNVYGYCAGDPINRHDPSGRIPQWLSSFGRRLSRAAPATQQVIFGAGNVVSSAAGASYLAASPGALRARRPVATLFFWSGIMGAGARATTALAHFDPARAATYRHFNDGFLVAGGFLGLLGTLRYEVPGMLSWMRQTNSPGRTWARSIYQASGADLVVRGIAATGRGIAATGRGIAQGIRWIAGAMRGSGRTHREEDIELGQAQYRIRSGSGQSSPGPM